MSVFKFIANLSTKRKFANLKQDQNEALIDTLAAAKAIDGKLLESERLELMDAMEMLDWKGGKSVDGYVDWTIDKATSLESTPEQLKPFFTDISDRLGEDWLRQEAYYLGSRVALADDEVVEQERVFLMEMVKAFGIPADRQQLIIRKIREEM